MRRHIDDLLPAYLNGTLGQDERDRVEQHLPSCEECRQALDEWRSIAIAARSLVAASTPPTNGMLDRVWAALDEPPEPRPKARRAKPLAEMTYEEKNAMNAHALSSTPYAAPRRISPLTWLASGLVLLLAMGSFAWYSMNPGGGGGPEPMPAAQLASNATPATMGCPDMTETRDLDVYGTPETSSVISLPKRPYEGGLHVRPENLPTDGEPADDATVTGISETVAELTACMNEGNVEATWALTTDDYVNRFVETGRDPNNVGARAIVPLVGPVALETPVPDVRNAIVLEDGRVGAEIRPSFNEPAGSFDYYVFANQDGRWLIDEAVHVQAFVQVDVIVDDDGFSPRSVTISQQAADLNVTNRGTRTHSMVVPQRDIRVELAPGESAVLTVKGPAGTYPFYSDMPKDYADGFAGTIAFEGTTGVSATPEVEPAGDVGSSFGVPTVTATIHLNPPESYSPDHLAVLADRDVELTLVNAGALDANFTIDALDISVDLAQGESETVTINAPEGAYAFYSTIPGHAQTGMSGILFVQAESSQP